MDNIIQQVTSHRIRNDYEVAEEERQKAMEEALYFLRYHIATPRLMEGPNPEVVARWILGKQPRELAPGLTKKEANLWILQSEHEKPKDWFWAHLVEKHPELEGCTQINTIAVGRWVDKMLSGSTERRDAMLTPRRGFIADAEVAGRIIDRLDEVQDVDLCNSAWGTLEAAQRRITEAEWKGDNELLKEEPWHKELPEGVRLLRHFTELRHEGKRMRHCVVSYARKVADRQCMIFSCQVGEKFSTCEIRENRVTQHVGFANGAVPPECDKVMKDLCRSAPWAQARQREFA